MSTLNDELRQALRRAYGQKTGERDQKDKERWKIAERGTFLKLIQAMGATNLLELGAGTGQDSLFFAEQGLEVLATDLTPENVAACRQKGIEARVMDVCDLQIEDASFDAVYTLNCFLHLPKSEFSTALENVHRVLQPGGLFFLGQYGGRDSEGIFEDDHYEPKRLFSFFTDEAIQFEARAFFNLVHFKSIALGEEDDLRFQSLILEKP